MITFVTTLILGLRPRQRLAKVWANNEAWESHFMLVKVYESAREWTPTLRSEFPLWELEPQWTLEYSKGDFKGQNSLDWRGPYTIGKLLEFRCLKWAHMTHLKTQNIGYDQKKGRRSNYQFDSQPLKVRNLPDLLACNILLERSWWRLQFCFKPHLNQRFAKEVINLQSRMSLNFRNFRILTGQNDIWV